MRKIFITALALILTLFTVQASANDSAQEDTKKDTPVWIEYGFSDIYSHEDMDAAIVAIDETFSKWQGCQLHNIRYAGDECNSAENLRWMNDLAEAQGYKEKLNYCIEFYSDFYVSREAENHTTLNPETEYKNWQWWLACSEKGEWKLLTFGY